MKTQTIKSTPKELILPTTKLLDLLIPILSIINPQKSNNRKKVNAYIYRNWRDSNKINVIEGIKITYKGQSGGLGSRHEWRVDITNASDRLKKVFEEFQRSSRLPVPVQPPQHNQRQNGTFEWNGLFFRSPAEVEIAKVLDRQSILFFPNSRCRVPTRNNHQDTIEVDFFIVYRGKMGILEVDGATYHTSAAADHGRDRLFMRQGVLCSRFTAHECLQNPELVVEQFLELFTAFSL